MINAGYQPTLLAYDVLIKGLQNEYLMVDQKLMALPDAVSDRTFDDQALTNMPLQSYLRSYQNCIFGYLDSSMHSCLE
jgi:hypothetical protein